MRNLCRLRVAGRSGPRRGSVLPLVAVLLFVFLPLAALVIDVGMVTLTRRQMQTAVNVGALEGLRVRDDANFTTPEKRTHVQSMVAHALSSSGIGPKIEFEDGTDLPGTEFLASRTVDASTLGPYIPDLLELNLDNDAAGDMVSGNWHADEESSHVESSGYERAEFEVVAPAQIPTANAFLVRLRRVSDESPVTDVSTVGPPVPFLFGRGPYGGAEWLDRRERGTHVRATAIASDSGVLAGTVGLSRIVGSGRLAGAAPLAIATTDWPLLASGTEYTVELETGDVRDPSNSFVLHAERLHLVPYQEGSPLPDPLQRSSHVAVAHPLVPILYTDSGAVPLDAVGYERFYAPLVATVATSGGDFDTRVVVGFGCIRLTHALDGLTATMSVEDSIIGPENCSATVADSAEGFLDLALASEPAYTMLDQAAKRAVLIDLIGRSVTAWRGNLGLPGILRAPALVRAIH